MGSVGEGALYSLVSQQRRSLNLTLYIPALQERSGFDTGVVVSFGMLLPASVLRMFRYGAINVHPSLLPRYRGAAPIQHALLNGDTETGVCIMGLSEGKFDQGAVISRDRYTIKPVSWLAALLAQHTPNHLWSFAGH